MRIYCDMDDILCETAASLCRLASARFGAHVAYADVRDFDLQKSFGLTDGQMRDFMRAAHEPSCLLSYPATPGAVAGLQALATAGHAVEIVTGRPASSHAATEAWLAAAGLAAFPVTYVNKYGRLFSQDGDAPEMVSREALLKRRYDLAIDDSPLILSALAAWTETRVLVFDRPWNRGFALAPNMTRVSGWAEILREAGRRGEGGEART